MGYGGNGKMSFLKSFEILEHFSYLYRFHTTSTRWDNWTWKMDEMVEFAVFCRRRRCQTKKKAPTKFWSPNISVSTCRMKTVKVWKEFKNFQTFRKFWKKGLLAPPTPPNPQMKFSENLKFSKISFVGLGVLGVPKALFFKIFGKFENF